MKHLIIAAVLLFSVLTFSSCKKNYNCKVVTTTNSNNLNGMPYFTPGSPAYIEPTVVTTYVVIEDGYFAMKEFERSMNRTTKTTVNNRTTEVTTECNCD